MATSGPLLTEGVALEEVLLSARDTTTGVTIIPDMSWETPVGITTISSFFGDINKCKGDNKREKIY